MADLTQTINVKTRGNAILDWCLTNVKKSFFELVQLPQLGTSDHNTILIQTRIPGHRSQITVLFRKETLDIVAYEDLANGFPLTIGHPFYTFMTVN
jgi:hypothetical protein